MELIIIIKNICSFFWKVKPYLLAGLVYILGRQSAKKDNQLQKQKEALQEQAKANQTLQAMQEAGVKAPTNKDDLITVLDKGDF